MREGILYLAKALTPIHPGAGDTVLGAADLVLQRDRLGVPIIEGSSLKGGIRNLLKNKGERSLILRILLGSEARGEGLEAGAGTFLNALPLLIPVRSLVGVWAYATTPWLLFLLANRLEQLGQPSQPVAGLALEGLTLNPDEVLAPDSLILQLGGSRLVVLFDEYAFKARRGGEAYQKFCQALKAVEDLGERLVVLPDEAAWPLLHRSMWIQQRVRLGEEKTVQEGGLWAEEHLPPATILHFALLCSESRAKVTKEELLEVVKMVGEAELEGIEDLRLKPEQVAQLARRALGNHFYLIVGGDETVGRGLIEARELSLTITEAGLPAEAPARPKHQPLTLCGPATLRAQLAQAAGRIEEDRPSEAGQGVPTLMAQAGLLPTYTYSRRKGQEEEEERKPLKERREWWVWQDLEKRQRQLLKEPLPEDLPEPRLIAALEQDLIAYTALVKHLSARKEGG